MSTSDSSKASAAPVSRGPTEWTHLRPKSIDLADTMPASRVSQCWNRIYAAAGVSNKGEDVKKGLRAAVYTYGLLNGTSREGSYEGEMTIFDGTVVPASVIPTSVGKMEIRKFYRGNMKESYEFLKTSGVVDSHPRFVAKVAEHSISSENAFAAADWLADCPHFTPSESKAHVTMFQYSVSRARRARDGRALEEVEAQRVERGLEAQGTFENHGSPVQF